MKNSLKIWENYMICDLSQFIFSYSINKIKQDFMYLGIREVSPSTKIFQENYQYM